MLWLLTVAITALIGPWLLKIDWFDVAFNSVVYSILAFFCFRGHRWAFVLSMILWTIMRAYSIVQALESDASSAGGRLFTSVIWWGTYMGVFWKALTVERMRRREQPSMVSPIE